MKINITYNKIYNIIFYLIILIICIVYIYNSKNQKVIYQTKKVKVQANSNILEESIMEDIKITIFEGELLTRLYAEEMTYQRGSPVRFLKPIVFHFGKDKMTKIQGNWGEMVLKTDKLGDMDFQNIRIWGNLRVEQKARARVAELADATDLKSVSPKESEGSSPSPSTNKEE